MYIEFNLNDLLSKQITPNEFVTALLLYAKNTELIDQLKALKLYDFEAIVDRMSKLRLLKDTNYIGEYDTKLIEVERDFIDLVKKDENFFQEILDIYPSKVTRTDGTKDYLRTDSKRCEKIYNKLTNGNKSRHERILKSLEFEVKTRTKEGSLAYMKRLPKWLASEEYKVFEQRMNDEQEIKNSTHIYGSELK